ncbi:hypothetical protein PQO01_17595 [Lentisphaera marina]|nr:hypothetical protein [Lentisphaera marina]MDD7986767.1 hypothetical protein [Lentisphaera marina]
MPNCLISAEAAQFNEIEEFELDHQIFIDSKPKFYDFANETHNMTGEEVFAIFMKND